MADERVPQTPAGTAWQATNDDMQTIAADRRADGWTTTAMPAVHTSPVSRDSGEDDRFGLVPIIPGNHAAAFSTAYENHTFPEYLAYRRQVEFAVFLVIEHLDPAAEHALLLACHYDARKAKGMVANALKIDELHAYCQTLDGTLLGTFTYPDPRPLLPRQVQAE